MLFKRKPTQIERNSGEWTHQLWSELKSFGSGVHGLMMIDQIGVVGDANFSAPLAQSHSTFSGRLGCEATSPLKAVKATMSFHTDEHLGSAHLSEKCVGWLTTVNREGAAELHMTVRANATGVHDFEMAFSRAKIFNAPFVPVWFWQDENLDELLGDDGKRFGRTVQLERVRYGQSLSLVSTISQDDPR